MISLLEWEMWVSSFVQSLVRKYGMCGGGKRFVFDTSTTTLKTKTKNKRYKRNIQKNDKDDIRMRNRETITVD